MDRTPDQIRSDIRKTRGELVLTLNQIQEQVNRPVRQVQAVATSPTTHVVALAATAGVAALATITVISWARERQRRNRLQRLTLGLLGQKSSNPTEDISRQLEERVAEIERAVSNRVRRVREGEKPAGRSVFAEVARVAVPALVSQGMRFLQSYLLTPADEEERPARGGRNGNERKAKSGGIPIRFNIGLGR